GMLVVGASRSLVVAELSTPQVLELYAMREILEGSAARFAAQHASEAEIDILQRVLDEFDKHADDALMLISLNRRFHRAVCEAAHNRYLIATLDGMHDALALLHSNTFRLPNRRTESDAEHRRIVRAIARRNADEAEQAARTHVRAAQRTRFSTLADEPGRLPRPRPSRRRPYVRGRTCAHFARMRASSSLLERATIGKVSRRDHGLQASMTTRALRGSSVLYAMGSSTVLQQP